MKTIIAPVDTGERMILWNAQNGCGKFNKKTLTKCYACGTYASK